MEVPQPAHEFVASPPLPEINQIIYKGLHENTPTNTHTLSGELIGSQDINKLNDDFDLGFTPLRDVGRMIKAQRSAILSAHQDGTLKAMTLDALELLFKPVENLHRRITQGEQDQTIGHNFFVNATGYLDAGFLWAKQFDAILRTKIGSSLLDIAQSKDNQGKDSLLSVLTNNKDVEWTKSIAVYLAGRSIAGENFLNQNYGDILSKTKRNAFIVTQEIGVATGLTSRNLERSAGQLRRASFGSFDHLEGLVTSEDSGAEGDYLTGSLRIEVHFDGSTRSANLRERNDAQHIIAHELQHAGSAQRQGRCGLRVQGQGLEANEGMTEYLAQLSIGSPGFEVSPNGDMRVKKDVSYRVPVFAMAALHSQFMTGSNKHFATLFNAFHGDVSNGSQLESALNAFYEQDKVIADATR